MDRRGHRVAALSAVVACDLDRHGEHLTLREVAALELEHGHDRPMQPDGIVLDRAADDPRDQRGRSELWIP